MGLIVECPKEQDVEPVVGEGIDRLIGRLIGLPERLQELGVSSPSQPFRWMK